MTASCPIKTKILVLGPPQSGKTTISNYLADSSEMSSHKYRPTEGVRIVEFESNELELDGERIDAEVELWDCSGQKQYERCWPAIRLNAHGAILVARADQEGITSLVPCTVDRPIRITLVCRVYQRCSPMVLPSSVGELFEYNEFVQRVGMSPSNVLVLLNEANSGDGAVQGYQIPPSMNDLLIIPSNIDNNGENLRLEFNRFLCNVINNRRRTLETDS